MPAYKETEQELKALNKGTSASNGKDGKLQERDSFVQSILNALMANIAVLDRDGKIIYVNGSWEDFARRNGETP